MPAATRCSSSTHHRSPANGRTCSDHPSGESQVSTLDPVADPASPTARRLNAAARTANATPLAVRALAVSCAATAATAVNTMPDPASARLNASDPAFGMSIVDRPAKAIRSGQDTGPETEQQGGGQPRLAPDGGRVEQLGTSGLFVCSGVADDGEDHRDRDQHMEHAGFPDPHRAEAVVVDIPVHRALCGTGHDGSDYARAVGGGGVHRAHAADVDRRQRHRQQQDPQRSDDTVTAQVMS